MNGEYVIMYLLLLNIHTNSILVFFLHILDALDAAKILLTSVILYDHKAPGLGVIGMGAYCEAL